MTTAEPTAFYLPAADGTFTSTIATTSPWDFSQQHGGPPSALLARAIEQCQPRPDLAVSRISVDFLGAIPQGVMTVSARVLRPGRRIELVEATLEIAGRLAVVARAWRMAVAVGTAPDVPAEPAPVTALPSEQQQHYFPAVDPSWGYGRAIEWRFVSGGFASMGPVQVWARPILPLVAGEASTGLQRALIIADSANGLSAELDLKDWLFVPPTLTCTAYRQTTDEWVLLDATTVIDSRGMGLANATLADRVGQFGIATQPLLVQRRPAR